MTLPCRVHWFRPAAVLLGLAALLAGCGGGASTATGSTATGSATTGSATTGSATTSASPGSASPAASANPGSGPLEAYVSRDVLTAPTRVAQTALGPVGYREIGAGPPLLLIMGLGGSMDAWQPIFLAALAQRHRVVLLDNAGVGDTAALTTPLTITEMADQTSDLIAALRLGQTAVLGWSMGGMIAQALAVLHPAQVRRLVLCATFPGVGTVVPPRRPPGRTPLVSCRCSSPLARPRRNRLTRSASCAIQASTRRLVPSSPTRDWPSSTGSPGRTQPDSG